MKIINIKKDKAELDELGKMLEEALPDIPLIAVCGGKSILKIFEPLKKYVSTNFFSKFLTATYIMVDERLVPLDDPECNFKLANNNFYKYLAECCKKAPEFIPFDISKIEASKKTYAKVVEENKGVLDLILLGAGEDGHIAGLFPNFEWDEVNPFFTFENSPKPPSGRMSASPKLISTANNVVLAFLGEGKRDAYNRFLANAESVRSLPCLLTMSAKNLIVVTDLT